MAGTKLQSWEVGDSLIGLVGVEDGAWYEAEVVDELLAKLKDDKSAAVAEAVEKAAKIAEADVGDHRSPRFIARRIRELLGDGKAARSDSERLDAKRIPIWQDLEQWARFDTGRSLEADTPLNRILDRMDDVLIADSQQGERGGKDD